MIIAVELKIFAHIINFIDDSRTLKLLMLNCLSYGHSHGFQTQIENHANICNKICNALTFFSFFLHICTEN